MNVYFIRHGESVQNTEKKFQAPHTPLSDLGKKQAETVANRFKKIPIDVIFSSPLKRTRETADIISRTINVPVQTHDLLTEIKRPSVIHKKLHDDPAARVIIDLIIENIEDKEWRHSDEETFFEFRERARDFITFLRDREEQNLLVVSHAVFLKMIMATMMMGDELEPKEFFRWYSFFSVKNTGITLCTFDNGDWRLITWNDHAHLG